MALLANVCGTLFMYQCFLYIVSPVRWGQPCAHFIGEKNQATAKIRDLPRATWLGNDGAGILGQTLNILC